VGRGTVGDDVGDILDLDIKWYFSVFNDRLKLNGKEEGQNGISGPRLINLCLCLQPQFAGNSLIWQMCLPILMAKGCVPATAGCVVVRLINRAHDYQHFWRCLIEHQYPL
jgi:hypothetical protein